MNKTIKFTKTSLRMIMLAYALIPIQYIALMLFGVGGFAVTMLANLALPLAQLLSVILLVVTLVSWKNTSNHILPSVPFLLILVSSALYLTGNYIANVYGLYSLSMNIEVYSGVLYFVIMLFVFMRYNKYTKEKNGVDVLVPSV